MNIISWVRDSSKESIVTFRKPCGRSHLGHIFPDEQGGFEFLCYVFWEGRERITCILQAALHRLLQGICPH